MSVDHPLNYPEAVQEIADTSFQKGQDAAPGSMPDGS